MFKPNGDTSSKNPGRNSQLQENLSNNSQRKKNEKSEKKPCVGTAERAVTCALFRLPLTRPFSAAEESAKSSGLPPRVDVLDCCKPVAYSMVHVGRLACRWKPDVPGDLVDSDRCAEEHLL